MLRILDQWLRFLFTGVALCLALEFILRIFAPGNPDTAWIFKALHPAQPWLDTASYYLTQPVDKIGSLIADKAPWLLHWIPGKIRACFPMMPAAPIFRDLAHWLLIFPHDPHGRFVQDIQGARYSHLFPGVIDWRLMMALPLWGWAETIASACIGWLENQLYQFSMRQHAKSEVKKLQQHWNAQNPKEQHAS